jgi:glycosyltransferase involved in cell wall biosynthesis
MDVLEYVMSDIKFSVVIPTRERPATLRHCLRTCLNQNFDDYEVIVSDNGSIAATREVVDEAASPKVRYVKTPEPLSLASSWEFAVSHARGEYVLVIGDDDGLLPHGLYELDKLTRETRQKVIRWDAAFYTWPNIALAGEGDYLRIPHGAEKTEIDSADAIQSVISFKQFYTILPMIYNSAIHKDVLAAIRSKTGRLFANRYADVYSGFSTAHVAGKYLSLDMPMSISGQSSASTGVAVFFFRNRSTVDRDFRDLSDRENLRENSQIPELSIFPHTAVADSFLDAKRLLFPHQDQLVLDQRLFIGLCMRNLRVESMEEWKAALELLRNTMSKERGDLEWYDEQISRLEYRPTEPFHMRPERLGFDEQYLHLDAAAFGVRDITGAAELCDRILNYRQYGLPHKQPSDAATRVLKLQQTCEGLQQICDDRMIVINKLARRVDDLEKRFVVRRFVKSILAKIQGLTKPFGSMASRSH